LKQPATSAAEAIDFPKIDKELVKTNFLRLSRLARQVRAAQENEKVGKRSLPARRSASGKT